MLYLNSSRVFRVFDWRISHNQLLIRSFMDTAEHSSNLDIIFSAVTYIELTAEFAGLIIEEPTPEEMTYLLARNKPCEERLLRSLRAGALQGAENRNEVSEAEISAALLAYREAVPTNYYALRSGGSAYFIIASALQIEQHSGDPFISTLSGMPAR